VTPPVTAAQKPAAVPQQSQEPAIPHEKVTEIAQKLGVPVTNELLSLKTNDAISSALIDKAVAAGKTEAQINAAMSSI